MALKDYYVEKNSKGSGSVTGPDSWALKYINIGRVPKILEAFDDDASGFITTNEVNTFTQSRPLGWRCASPHRVSTVICSSGPQSSPLVSLLGNR